MAGNRPSGVGQVKASRAIAILAMVALSALLGAREGRADCDYNVTVIQPVPCPIFGIVNIFARGISDTGHVVGWRSNCSLTDDVAFHWAPQAGLVDIPFPAGTIRRRAADINNDGRIVGSADFPNDALGDLAFVYDSAIGKLISLGTVPGGNQSEAMAVNELGQVVGNGVNISTGDPPLTPFLWQDGVMTALKVPAGPHAAAVAINNPGQVTGWMGVPGLDSQVYVWKDGVATPVGQAPGAFASEPTAINHAGQILIFGRQQEDESSPILVRSFVWDAGTWTDLGQLAGFDRCFGLDLNDAGQVVGYCTQSAQPNRIEAFFWQNGVIIALNDLLPGEFDGTASVSWGMNQAGQIIATGGYQDDPAALLLAPLNQPDGDIDHDCSVGHEDFVMLLAAWGPCPPVGGCLADLNGDGAVDIVDFLMLLANWT